MGDRKKKFTVETKVHKPFLERLQDTITLNRKMAVLKDMGSLEHASVRDIVDGLIQFAYTSKASDIHIDPLEAGTVIRYRIDGILHDVLLLDAATHEKVITRIKVLSELRTDEHYTPQDGRFRVNLAKTSIDMRISIVPTYFGENVVIRLLVGETRALSLEELGFSERDFKMIHQAMARSYGMIIVTGPTGAGKTTTLYSVLEVLNARERSIITIEDPIEFTVNGVTQIQVNPHTELTFARGLRAIVRQDPNIIMVGEIRDEETAEISVNAAMTGHLLLSTLHANSSSVTLPRLLDMGIEPFLIASTINLAIGQRLVRRLCTTCRKTRSITAIEMKSLADVIPKSDLTNLKTVYEPDGCDKCSETGYIGRVGIYEVLIISEGIKHLIMQRQDADQIQKLAVKEGMTTMVSDGMKKVREGITSLAEVLRVISE